MHSKSSGQVRRTDGPSLAAKPSDTSPLGFTRITLALRSSIHWKQLKLDLTGTIGKDNFTRLRRRRRKGSPYWTWVGSIKTSLFRRLKEKLKHLYPKSQLRTQKIKRQLSGPIQRKKVPPRGVETSPTPGPHGRAYTWNIATLTNKRRVIRHFLRTEKAQVLALQETQRTILGFPMTAEGYTVFETTAALETKETERGLALLIRSNLNPLQVGRTHTNFIFARIPPSEGKPEWLLGNVYSPARSGLRANFRKILTRAIAELQEEFPHAHLLLMGDFNEPHSKFINRTQLGLTQCPFSGSDLTFYRSRRRPGRQPRLITSAIDYFLTNAQASKDFGRAVVRRQWDESDHWPVRININLARNQPATTKPSTKKKLTPEIIRGTTEDDAWTQFQEESFFLPEGTLQDKFTQMVQEVIERHLEPQNSRPTLRHGNRPLLSREEKTLLTAKQGAHVRWWSNQDPSLEEQLHGEWKEARRIFREAHRTQSKKRWVDYISRGIGHFTKGRNRELWLFMYSLLNRRKGSLAIDPMRDPTGETVTRPQDIINVWRNHYQGLGDATEIQHMDAAYWEEKLRHKPNLSPLPEMDKLINVEELLRALHHLKAGKAPGPSGLPSELWKLCHDETKWTKPLDNPFLKTLLQTCNEIFIKGPSPDLSTSEIVSIYKDGDRQDPGNYRGISLMETLLKVVCTIVTARVQSELDRTGRLIREQAGFRSPEETLAQSCALLDILQRRREAGFDTWLAFVDFKKAFDTVSHEGIFAKCRKIGIHGKVLNFIKLLYRNSKVRARAGALRSDPFSVERGVRQGCPLSPTLFLIFINDIYDDAPSGVTIPRRLGYVRKKCPGLLFADDEVTLAENPRQMKRALRKLGKWAIENGMAFGIKKCGIMRILVNPSEEPPPIFMINDEIVPNVTSYKYLGIVIEDSLKPEAHSAQRIEKGMKILTMISPILRNWTLPLNLRKLLCSHLLAPVLMYGCEIGIGVKATRDIERIFTISLKHLLRISPKDNSTSGEALRKELGFDSLADRIELARYRLFTKYNFNKKRTWLATLGKTRNSARLGSRTWTTKTLDGLKTRKIRIKTLIDKDFRRKRTAQWVEERAVKRRNTRRGDLISLKLLHEIEWGPNLKRPPLDPGLILGESVLVKMRVNAFWTGKRTGLFRGAGEICPVCGESEPETIAHILTRCRAWRRERDESGVSTLLRRILSVGEDQTRTSLEVEALELLGGSSMESVAKRHFSSNKLYEVFFPLYDFLGSVYYKRLVAIYGHQSSTTNKPKPRRVGRR